MPDIVTKPAGVIEAAKDVRWRPWSYIREATPYVVLLILCWHTNPEVAAAAGLALVAAMGSKAAHGHAKKKADQREIEESSA